MTKQLSEKQTDLISEIVGRCQGMFEKGKWALSEDQLKEFVLQFIEATHKYNLDLEKLLAFDDFNFSHDVLGILRHWEGTDFTDYFWPRCGRLNKKKEQDVKGR